MLADYFILLKSELILTAIILLLLIMKVSMNNIKAESVLNTIHFLLIVNLFGGLIGNATGDLFGQMFYTNPTIALQKNILNVGVLLISMQAYSWLKTHKHFMEFYMLLLSTLLGMFFMISSKNLLMFYLGLELSTIPLAAMSNFDLDKRKSSEAALKMILSSAFSSGILLFGISLIYGTTGSFNFNEISAALVGSQLQILAFIMLFAGFAFKISAVPFHLWTADVYEGSPIVVTSYLSVISKGAILFVFVSVLYTVFRPMAQVWYNVIFITSVLTMIIGNLFAIRQDSFKRFLAFSSIAQVGFILIGVSAGSQTGMASVIYFVMIYIFSNIAAFTVISIVSAFNGKENISDYKGFYKTNPFLAWVLTIALFSLAGIPPTAGFFGKLFLITAGAGTGNYVLITIAVLNMIISLYYYLRIIKVMFMDENENPIENVQADLLPKLGLIFCLAGILAIGFYSPIYDYIHALSFGL